MGYFIKLTSFSFKKIKLPLLAASVLLVGFFTTGFLFVSPVQAAWTDIGRSLPDDAYKLRLPSGGEAKNVPNGPDGVFGTSDDCYQGSTGPRYHGNCSAYSFGSGESHQYITLTRGSINDDNRPPSSVYPEANYARLEIFTDKNNKGNKNVTIRIVNRGIGADRACSGYDINYIYKKPDNTLVGQGSKAINSCSSYALHYFPSEGFQEIIDGNGNGTGVFKGQIELRLPADTPLSKQASFHLNTASGGTRFGYAGGDNWINTYPTNAADHHKVVYRFSPPCQTPTGTPIEFGWDDVNQGNPSYQPDTATFKVFRQHRDGSNKTQVGPTRTPGVGVGYLTLSSGNYSSGKPYVYSIEFENIYGGNGISFMYPYDSASFFLDCPDPTCIPGSPACPLTTKWKLDPGTTINQQIGSYTAQYANPTSSDSNPSFNARKQANVSRAKAAFDDARFKHYVNEVAGQRDAPNGEHRWTVQFKTIRAGGAESSIYDKPAPLNNLSVHATAGGAAAILVGNSRAQINSEGMKFLFRNATDTAYRNPALGDQYCERVRDNNGGAAYANGTAAPHISSWKCVVLSNNPPCQEEPWSVKGSASVTSNNGSPNDAWVGQTFNFNYAFSNNGPADTTKTINFYHNSSTATDSHPLGSWNPSYGRVITPADGGTVITDQMAYEPTQSAGADNCGIFGNNTLSNSITVPYYFHLKPTSGNLSDKTQQGDPASPQLTINLPPQDNQGDLSGDAASDNEFGGRPHTNSSATNWRIIEFRTDNINDAKNKIPKNKSGGSGDCAEIGSFGVTGFSGCANVASGNQAFGIGDATFTYNRPAGIDPVGTNICYVGVVSSPTHSGSPGSRYSNLSCTTIVKSPKMQFLNGDLTVGRYRLTDGGSPCKPPESTASIQATGAPGVVTASNPPDLNLYGSWVEYGAFASGDISGFGSAAYADTGGSDHTKLRFGNTPSAGNYSYAAECLSNPFDLVKPTDVNDITANAPDLRLNEYFATHTSDKTGHVSSGQNIELGQTPAPAPQLDDNYAAFKGRDIIIYAKASGACNGANGGTITIKNDITYAKSGYGDISQLPRIILLADCKIIINDNVKRVDAWLIAKDAVATCSENPTGMKFKDRTVTHTDCTEQLVINGPVQAKRLLLWRTHGTDLTDMAAAKEAAEVFNLRPDHMLSTFARGRDAGKPHTIYQTDLPPLY